MGVFEPPVCGGISKVNGNHSNVVVSVVLVENNSILVVSVLKQNHRNWLLIVVLKLQKELLL